VGGIQVFQIENAARRPLFRIVLEPNVRADTIQNKLDELWSNSVDFEFVDSTALKLQGWRSKFRHLVTPPLAVSLESS
jgi:hypothetical protein